MTEHETEPAEPGIFADLSAAEREMVSAAAHPVRFGPGERVFREGTPARGCLPEVAELDLNPVIARPDGSHVVDARIHLRPAQPSNPYLRQLR